MSRVLSTYGEPLSDKFASVDADGSKLMIRLEHRYYGMKRSERIECEPAAAYVLAQAIIQALAGQGIKSIQEPNP